LTREEYEKKLKQIVEKLENEEGYDATADLELLKHFLPVRLGWYYADAINCIRKENSWQKLYSDLEGKYLWAYNYPYAEEIFRLYLENAKRKGLGYEIQRQANILKSISSDYSFYAELFDICSDACQKFDPDVYMKVYLKLFEVEEKTGFLIHQKVIGKYVFPEALEEFAWVKKITNMGYLIYELDHENAFPFVLIESKENYWLVKMMVNDLKMLGKEIFWIRKPLIYSSDNVKIEDTLSVSVNSIEHFEGVKVITPVELERSCGYHEVNTDFVLNYIQEKFYGGKLLNVISDGFTAGNLSISPILKKKYSRLTGYGVPVDDNNLCLSYCGSYLDYISNIYQNDVRRWLNKKRKKRFSIVIPARNSAETLRYTILTCLDQTYDDYEILISDNSTGTNHEVYDLYNELANPKLVYLKTPYDLRLVKSFEYAYLHAEGEYIFAIGSDDGLLPWALEVLDKVISEYPEEEIIQWERGFYAWPGFNGAQQNQFVVPRPYQRGQYQLYFRDKADYIVSVLKCPESMYGLPMLYNNSCFKRSYFKTLLDQTGCLWDGICQDIDMGIITAAVHNNILNMKYPLAIVGMSSRSAGAKSNSVERTSKGLQETTKEYRELGNTGGFGKSYYEQWIPQILTDTNMLYSSILRAIGKGILQEAYLTKLLDWKKIFADIALGIDIRDVAFDKKIHEMRYAAMMHGEEFLEWFDNVIYERKLTPVWFDEEMEKKYQPTSYSVGVAEDGMITLDASEYGVSNIYEAVQLFSEITGLGDAAE